jgi:hypothetical protein
MVGRLTMRQLRCPMTDKPSPTPPHKPLVLPPNCRDVTAEKIGTVIGIVGATGAGNNRCPTDPSGACASPGLIECFV